MVQDEPKRAKIVQNGTKMQPIYNQNGTKLESKWAKNRIKMGPNWNQIGTKIEPQCSSTSIYSQFIIYITNGTRRRQ